MLAEFLSERRGHTEDRALGIKLELQSEAVSAEAGWRGGGGMGHAKPPSLGDQLLVEGQGGPPKPGLCWVHLLGFSQ